MNAHLDFLARMRAAGPAGAVPGQRELSDHLRRRLEAVGASALQEFAHVQRVASTIWGPERTSHFAIVLRQARVSAKPARKTRWQKARSAVERLPPEWRGEMRLLVELSQAGSSSSDCPEWSADYIGGVAAALCRYVDHARENGLGAVPNGADLDRYARWLTDPENKDHDVSVRGAADYIARIHAGLSIVAPSPSRAREFVVRYWSQRAKSAGTPTKTGAQLVGAVTIYDLGFDLIETARQRPMRGIRAATIFRNGLILTTGISLPQRARAISSLDFGTTLRIVDAARLRARIPAAMLKKREDRKAGDPFDIVWRNARLVDALNEYRKYFRPLFDDGTCLFPSVHAPGQSISEMRIGKLTAKLIEKAFGVAVSIHRLRDNAATESSENLVGGRRATAALLGHADIAAGDPYDHSDAAKAAAEFDAYIDQRRTAPVDLAL